jgi:hypothetical protein
LLKKSNHLDTTFWTTTPMAVRFALAADIGSRKPLLVEICCANASSASEVSQLQATLREIAVDRSRLEDVLEPLGLHKVQQA